MLRVAKLSIFRKREIVKYKLADLNVAVVCVYVWVGISRQLLSIGKIELYGMGNGELNGMKMVL